MPRTVGLLFSNKPRRGVLGGDQYALCEADAELMVCLLPALAKNDRPYLEVALSRPSSTLRAYWSTRDI
jgi:hypothetical protein